MIVSRAEAQRRLGKSLEGLGKGRRSYYVLTKDGARNLGGPYSMAGAKKRLKQVETFKRMGNPRPKEAVVGGAAGRKIFKTMKRHRLRRGFSAKDASQATGLTEVEARSGIDWLKEHRYAYDAVGGKYKISVANPLMLAEELQALPPTEFGLPRRRMYPMTDIEHAIDADVRAMEDYEAGIISKAEMQQVHRRSKQAIREHYENNPHRRLYIQPNESARTAARRGLEARAKAPKSKRGGLTPMQAAQEGVGSGVARARDIAAGKKVNAYQVKAFFDRHRGNYLTAKAKGLRPRESRVIQSWLLWGGEPLRKQAEQAVKRDRAQRNPSRPFWGRKHDWDEVLIARDGRRLTRRQIRDYYHRNRKKIWPFLKEQTVMVVFASKRNQFVRRRHGPDGKFIKLTKLEGIDDPRSYEYWINRRVVEFHPTLMTKASPLLWLDLDMHKTKSAEVRKRLLAKMKRAVPKLKKVMKKMGVRRVHVYSSGTSGGIHLEGNFDKPRAVDPARREFTKLLAEEFADDFVFTTGLAKAGQIRLDTTTFHKLGSLRAPYSMTVAGMTKAPIKA